MKARPYRLVLGLVCLLVLVGAAVPASADTTVQPLPFAQDWTNTGLITANDNWAGVPGVIGYRGDGLTSTGTNPQTLTADGSSTPVNVIANQTNTNLTTGGIAEFHLANPVVALQGSGTADAPHLVLSVDTTGDSGVTVAYNLRDIDGGNADNAVQQVALQYRVGSSGSYTNIPAGYVADATTGPSQATLVTPVSVVLPAAADNQPLVQIRIITADAAGSDEWVGIDDISVTSSVVTPADDAPAVESTSPGNGDSEVATSANVEVTFSEPVTTSAAAFSITCSASGAHTFALSGGPTTYTLNPDSNFANGESCSVTVDKDGVSDTDGDDPPDNMSADHTFSFSTMGVFARIYEIQGASHTSPYADQLVSGVPGVITAVRPNSLYIQDALGDGNDATSDAILVFRNGIGTGFAPGQAVLVSGRVTEFRPGGSSSTNLTTTEITSPTVTPAGPGATIAPTIVGQGGRIPPASVIDDDATGSVETSGSFDAATDGIDFYESMEAMLLQVNDAVVTGARNNFGEVWVLADDGADAFFRTSRGGIVIRATDFNPERIQLEDDIVPGATPAVNVGDHFTTSAVGVLEYNFGNFEVMLTSALTRVDGGLAREVTAAPKGNELSVATFNVENLDPSDAATIPRLAAIVVDNLRSPDLIGIEEMQDNTGGANDGTTNASLSWEAFIAAIEAAGGPAYEYRQIDPENNQDGGQPGGNIRVGFLFRPDRGLAFVDRPGGDATTPTGVFRADGKAHLTLSPGRVDPLNPAWAETRKPLAGEFTWNGKTLIAIVNHFSSKGGDHPLFGRFQPPVRSSEVARHQQAASVNAFVQQILAAERKANVIVFGDINDFEFSETTQILEGDGELHSLVPTLPGGERYSYVFEGNSQVLDQILFSDNALRGLTEFDVVHVNAEFHDQASDHDPSVARLKPLGGGGGGK